ncbi:unnamed protein product [Symbiodinium sp. CCMP2592]|nr:unnamed protein product [Symbiodinium sp. CCMP2592]
MRPVGANSHGPAKNSFFWGQLIDEAMLSPRSTCLAGRSHDRGPEHAAGWRWTPSSALPCGCWSQPGRLRHGTGAGIRGSSVWWTGEDEEMKPFCTWVVNSIVVVPRLRKGMLVQLSFELGLMSVWAPRFQDGTALLDPNPKPRERGHSGSQVCAECDQESMDP